MSAVPAPTRVGLDPTWTDAADRLLRLVYRTGTAARQLRRLLSDRISQWELSDSEILILWLCWQPGKAGRVQGELATALGISPAQTSALVEGLRKRGLLLQERSALDRRRQMWQLTALGETLLNQIGAAVSDLADGFEAEFSADEHRLADAVTERLFEVLQNRPRLRAFDPTETQAIGQGGAR
jgi:DNA-binding MarR family transcriptional regulator